MDCIKKLSYEVHIDAATNGIVNGIKLVGLGGISIPYLALRTVDLLKTEGVDRVRNWLYTNFAKADDVLRDHETATIVSSYIHSGKLGNFENQFNSALSATPTLATSPTPDQTSFEDHGKAYYFIYKIDAMPASAPSVDDALRRSMFTAYSKALEDLGSKIIDPTLRPPLSTDLDLVEMVGGCTDATNKYYLFLRAPQNSALNREYATRRAGTWKGGTAMEMKKKDLFEAGELTSVASTSDDFLEIQVNNGLKNSADVVKFLNYFDTKYAGLGYEQTEVFNMVKGYGNSIDVLDNPKRQQIFTQLSIPSGNVMLMSDVEIFQKKREQLEKFVSDKFKEQGYSDQTARSRVLLQGLRSAHYSEILNFWTASTPISENILNDNLINQTIQALVDNLERAGKITSADNLTFFTRYKNEFAFT
ncbi:hypothetical protein HYV57_04390 [Candidatus Peregrinibacteria bacterium]|nr:hypothetical protein [Candidatus Peregrinibacteria bacterium]